MKNLDTLTYAELKELYNTAGKNISEEINRLAELSTTFMCRAPKAGCEKLWAECEAKADKMIQEKKEIKIAMQELADIEAPKGMNDLHDEDAPINIYIADLGAYNNGQLKGQWVALPQDEEVLEMIVDRMSNFGEGDIAIHDYECSFMKISEYDNISSLNEMAEEIQDLDETERTVVEVYMENVSEDLEEAISIVNDGDFSIYHDCQDMSDVATQYCEETGILSEIPDRLRFYFDFEAFGRDMDLEGTFIYHNGDYYEFRR